MRKGVNTKKGIEFVMVGLDAVAKDTLYKKEIKLGLLDDEMAQIIQIDSSITPSVAATSHEFGGMLLSLDPDSDNDPLVDTGGGLEDLEVLYNHRFGGIGPTGCEQKIENFDPPINVGTNIGMTLKVHETANNPVGVKATVAIYFKRVKASDVELAKILLKRR